MNVGELMKISIVLVSKIDEVVDEITVVHKKVHGIDVYVVEKVDNIEQDHIFVGNNEVENCKHDSRIN